MSLESAVMEQMKEAMKAKAEGKLRALRAIKAAIILAKTSEGAGGVLKPEDELKMLQKMMKQRKDSFDIFSQQGRADLAAKEQEEMEVLNTFLPKQLGTEEVKAVLRQIIADTGASSAADMGKVMGAATKQLAGQADDKTISTLVKELLAG